MWTVIDQNTHVMTVVGGALYRFSDERGSCMQFVPYVQTQQQLGGYFYTAPYDGATVAPR